MSPYFILREIVPTSAWNHIALAFKKEEISRNEMREIIINNCDEDIKNDVVLFIEKLRNELYKEERMLRNYSPNVKIPHYLNKTRNEIKDLFYLKFKAQLPINMLEVITLYLNSLYK